MTRDRRDETFTRGNAPARVVGVRNAEEWPTRTAGRAPRPRENAVARCCR